MSGAAYLCGWGCACCWRDAAGHEGAEGQEVRFWRGFRRGPATNLLDPKVGAFYVAMLPQFIPDGAPHALVGLAPAGVHVAEGLVWSMAVIGFASLMSGFLRSARVRRLLDRVSGVVIVGFGVRLAVSD